MNQQVEPRRISFTAIWADAAAMLRANAGLLAAIAGVFLLLPGLIMLRVAPWTAQPTTPQQLVEAYQAYMAASWYWIVLNQVAAMVGVAAITSLLLAPPGTTVGRAIGRAFALLPAYFILSWIFDIVVAFGFMLFVVPGIYLLGRFALAFPILVAGDRWAPFSALQQAWTATRGGRAWPVAGLIIIVKLAALFIGTIFLNVFGSLALLVGGGSEGIGGFIDALLNALVQSVILVMMAVLYAALFRAVQPRTA